MTQDNKYPNWFNISKEILTEEFIIDNKNNLNWVNISRYQILSENFIRHLQDYVDWANISTYQHLSENFISEFKHKVNWHYISKHQKLSENFIRQFQNNVDWYYISIYQHLSENIIDEFLNKMQIYDICKYQPLSENFIKQHISKLNLNYIANYQKLSIQFINEFNISNDNNNWLYKNIQYKKEQILNCHLFDCYNEYFIAYKCIRNDRYAKLNFQFQYIKDNTYYAHANHNYEDNSFGIHVSTKNEAIEYGNPNDLIVRCKIYYNDVARLVNKNGKIRCSKITVID